MSTFSPPSRLRSPHLRAAVAGLCLVAQAFALVHLFAVRHVRCAEHGELAHVDGAGHGAGATRADGAGYAAEARDAQGAQHAEGPQATVRPSGLAVEAHQDDHCMALSERRDLRAGAVTQVASSPQVMGELHYLYSAPLLIVRPLYRLAPKISPPAFA